MRRPARSDVRTGRLRAADPFELIRWLARSQTDPRKALAELVQNSLDAQARTVTITRVRERGLATLRLLDDGEGVIPELARPEALAYVATHIGHSRKRNLTPEQRRELLLQGQYGIGLLGFWSIGAELEMRSAVAGGGAAGVGSWGACASPAAGRSCTTILPPRSTAGSPSSRGTRGASAGSSTSPTSPWRRARAAASSSTRRRTPSRVRSMASSPPPCRRFSPRTSAGARRPSRRTSCTSSSARFATYRVRRRSTTFSPCGESRGPWGPQRRPATPWWRQRPWPTPARSSR